MKKAGPAPAFSLTSSAMGVTLLAPMGNTTTSLKLTDELKEKVGELAHGVAQTPHAYMVEAIAEKVARDEKRREFIDAAIASGLSTPAILWRHIVPNVAGPVIAYATLTIPQMILFESFLSFLGLGVQEPYASLGSLINEGAQEMESSAWMLLVPATLLTAMLIAFNLLGDGLRATRESRDD